MKYFFTLLISFVALYGCSSIGLDEVAHRPESSSQKITFGDGSDDLGINGVMPTIGKIYIDNVTVGSDDGGEEEMLKAHLIYKLSADIIVDNYTYLKPSADGKMPYCEWATSASGVIFYYDNGTSSGTSIVSDLVYDSDNDTYNCNPVTVDFRKNGANDANYDPDSLVTVSYYDVNDSYITAVGSESKFSSRINLNTADRHNIMMVATSPTTVLFHRRDGLFQAGYTAYRGMKGLQQYIGSAMYEARVQAPGAVMNVKSNSTYPEADLQADRERMNRWLTTTTTDENIGIYSESAFVASYGPPIALPDFVKSSKPINYPKLRIALLRHNNYPIIISHDKKMYSMGAVTKYDTVELSRDYPYFIRQNDNWFTYSGVYPQNTSDLYSTFQVGEIKPADGTPAKFVTSLSITSDLDTTIALNEIDKEYYIAGNPHWNENFCSEGATYNEETIGFTYNFPCYYATGRQVGAKKIVGLQQKLGDGTGAIVTDSEIFYIGRDGKGYKIDIRPDGTNGDNIRNGNPVVSELVTWNDKVVDTDKIADVLAEQIYVKDMAYANMNHAVLPTLLLSDGSIVFTVRKYVENSTTGSDIGNEARRFFINSNGRTDNVAGDPGNIRITKLIGPTAGYGEDGNIYYFTDVPALGVSYAPKNAYGTEGNFNNPSYDTDYLAFIYGDPIQFFGDISEPSEKRKFFILHYGKIDIDADITRLDNGAQKLGNNFAYLPYNPLTGQVENFLVGSDNSISLQTVAYRPFRTNSHLFVNMNKDADKSYISVPSYFYGFNYETRLSPSTWMYRRNGLMAAEVKHRNISKVFGTLKSPDIPFRYTPYGRNTTFFANKVGIFSFVDYNVRKTRSVCMDTPNQKCGNNSGLNNNKAGVEIIKDNSTNFPDYFYFGKSSSTNYDEEASGVNNYISTPLVKESRITNYPYTKNYTTTGFEPQLLSSWYNYEFERVPNDTPEIYTDSKTLPGFILSYWYDNVTSRFSSEIASGETTSEKVKYFKDNLTNFLSQPNTLLSYQYRYGIGEFRYYPSNAYPVWRARKLNTEVLQYQTRYGTLVPLSHGQTFGELASMLNIMFDITSYLNESSQTDTKNSVANRKYMTGYYAFYDRDAIMKGEDLGANVFGSMITPLDNMTTNKIGYIADKGNYMWRSGACEGKSPIDTEGNGSSCVSSSAFPFVKYNN